MTNAGQYRAMNMTSRSPSPLRRLALPWFALSMLLGLTSCESPSSASRTSPANPNLGQAAPGPQPLRETVNISGSYHGSYTYGPGYQNLAGNSVRFHIAIQQTPGSEQFTGTIDEDYSGFGTPLNGRLWADIRGTCRREGAIVKVHFTKTYRYFAQESVIYQGTFPAGGGTLAGTWHFGDASNLSGTFVIGGLRP